jgi:hypothetical protein
VVEEYLDPNIPIVEEISGIAESILITQTGYCNWENIYKLENLGFHVFPLERDSFGWILGGISTNKGIITYG